MSDTLQLYGTPLSHFTRKIRILLAELGANYTFVRTPGVLATNAATYANNPLMRVPSLIDGEQLVIESDHIARYLVNKLDPSDRLSVRSDRVEDLNHLAVVNGIMNNEVVLILAKRGGVADLDNVVYFRKLTTAMNHGLAWLEDHTNPDKERFDYGDIVTVCMWQHVVHYASATGLEQYSHIAARVANLSDRPSIAQSTPIQSLADAAAAGWTPG